MTKSIAEVHGIREKHGEGHIIKQAFSIIMYAVLRQD